MESRNDIAKMLDRISQAEMDRFFQSPVYAYILANWRLQFQRWLNQLRGLLGSDTVIRQAQGAVEVLGELVDSERLLRETWNEHQEFKKRKETMKAEPEDEVYDVEE